MNSIQLPKIFCKYLFEVKPVFTKPSFEYFNALILGILLGRPKKTVTAAIKIANLHKHFSNVNRFVSKYSWDAWQLGVAVLKLIIKVLNLSHCTLTIAIDSTLLNKFGPKIFGCGFHFNSDQKKNKSKYIWGHEWLVMGLLYYSKLFDKRMCFPFLAELFVPKKYQPENHVYKSSIEIAVNMLRYLQRHIKQNIILVGDGYFAKHKLLKTCIELKIPLISRLQSNAALFHTPEQVKKRGRPPLYGKRLSPLSQQAKNKNGFSELTLKLYGKKRRIRVKRVDAIWKPAGQKIQVMIVYYDKQKKPAFFLCTDLSFSAKDIVTRVAARWSLENIFKDLKEHLGWSHWQCRVEKAVCRSATLTCSAASLLTLWSLNQASQRQPEFWDPLPWYTRKATPSMKDMIEQLRDQILDQSFYAINHQCKTIAEKERAIRCLCKLAA
jgi:hypothetical protein